jgi:uncharacterized protein YuzE
MKIRYDRSVDAAYVSFLGDSEEASFGFAYSCDPKEVGGQINLDFDISGRLIGIEILQASKTLPASLIANA